MPSRCIVGGCGNTSKDGVSLHRFPVDPKYRSIWTERVQRARPTWSGPTQHSAMCSAHFEPACYDKKLYVQFDINVKQLLLKHAIPTIFPGCTDADKLPEEQPEFKKNERNRVLDELLGLGQTCKQDVSGGGFSSTKKEPVPVSIIRVCEEDTCNHFHEGQHPLPNEHTDDVEKTVCARPQKNFQTTWLEEEVKSLPTQPTSGKRPSKIIKLKAVSVSQRFVVNNTQHRQNACDVPTNTSKETDLRAASVLCLAPVFKPLEEKGQTRQFYVVLPNTSVSVPCLTTPHSDTSVQDNLKKIKTERVDQYPTLADQWQTDWKGENDESPSLALQGDPTQSSCTADTVDQPPEDSSHPETSEEDIEDDNSNMRDHSSDEDYVPEATVSVSKRKKKQRGRALRPRRACRKARVDFDQAKLPKGDTEEEHSSESEEEGEDKQDEDLPLSGRDSEEDLLSSSEDTDELERRERQAKKRKLTKRSSYVRLEIRFSRLPKMYECKTCHERIKEAEDMKRHHTEFHSKEPNKMAVGDQQQLADVREVPSSSADGDMAEIATELRRCKKCEEYVDNMPKHYRVHLEKRFVCEVCEKRFTSRWAVNYHKLRHEPKQKDKQYKCTKCNKFYPTKPSFDSHNKRVHSGRQLWVCEHCGKQFSLGKSLSIHRLIHLKEKPFKCSECGRGFSQKSNMTLHMRTHTGVRPYKCDVCEESFNHNVSLKTHQKKAHGIDWWKDKDRAAVS